MKRLIQFIREADSGQAIIFFAVLSSALMGTVGLAIEGGRVFVEYRRVQAAADMAALVGAQSLPCGTSDAACASTATTQACTYASANGFSSCTGGGASAPSANVPPVSCSPYDFLDYGNGSGNAHCKATSAPPFYDYIEVRLTDNLGTIPIFNIPVTLTAHAVAKHGTTAPGDFALYQLDPAGTFSASSVSLNGSAFGNTSISTSGSACGGGWYTHGTSVSGGVTTNNTGTPTFAPVGCTGGSNDTTALTAVNQPQATDPYTGSLPPPTVSGNGNTNTSIPGCPECTQTGWWWNLDSGGWTQGTPGKHVNAELFPGIYGSLPNGGGQGYNWYFNPGVYTFTGGLGNTTIRMCVYGAPVCDDSLGNGGRSGGTGCDTSSFSPGSASGNQYYYACSPFGFWDSQLSRSGGPGSALPTTGPTWYDASTGASTSTPLNGVTIYFPPNSGGIQGRGNSSPNWLAAPNPCPGTGTWTSGSTPVVSFPAGADTGIYTYAGGLPDNIPHSQTTSTGQKVYPSMDLSLLGECVQSTHLVVWPGEMVKPQHLHFVFYMQGPGSDSFLRGGFDMYTYGIVYAPTSTWSQRGNANSGVGPPTIAGQMVVGSFDLGGASSISISYRPCGTGSTACGSGYGTQLVQ